VATNDSSEQPEGTGPGELENSGLAADATFDEAQPPGIAEAETGAAELVPDVIGDAVSLRDAPPAVLEQALDDPLAPPPVSVAEAPSAASLIGSREPLRNPAATRGSTAHRPGVEQSLDQAGLDLLLDIPLQVSVELGRTRLTVSEILSLRVGSVLELDKMAGEPGDVLVNGTLVARGEVVVVDEKFGIRIVEVLPAARRLAAVA
jgi:flagellar motor switch protein FliN